ncbi:MAG: hypothetical protein EOP04_20515 [Proteobacteria bacterium]|nr:MAG: hypothetical protein EOP04_20515 [Pseudomonadota bacterium]
MTHFRLLGFRVQSFRSVQDSGWIDVENVGSLIGINESGKSNLLLPLWKLRPAHGGQIDPIADYPRVNYNDIRSMAEKPKFITARFEIPEYHIDVLREITFADVEELKVAEISRSLDGSYTVSFPNENRGRTVPKSSIQSIIEDFAQEIKNHSTVHDTDTQVSEKYRQLSEQVLQTLQSLPDKITEKTTLSVFNIFPKEEPVEIEMSTVVPRIIRLMDDLSKVVNEVGRGRPGSSQEARNYIVAHTPKFVYYSNYGNLDSEIYLPHVIDNLTRKDWARKSPRRREPSKFCLTSLNFNRKKFLTLEKSYQIRVQLRSLIQPRIKLKEKYYCNLPELS